MKCTDALRLLSPFIDSELDPRTSFDIGRHLEACPACARRFAAEIALEAGIVAALRAGPPQPSDEALWQSVAAAVRAEAGRAGRPRGMLLAGALLAALGALIGLLWVTLSGGPAPAPLGALGKGACHSHDGYLAGTEAAEVVTAVPGEVSAFFHDRLGLDVRPPADLALVGARRCAFGTVHVAFVMARRGREPVSVFVLPARDLAVFPEARAALDRDGGSTRARIHGHEMVLATRGELVVCVVSAPEAGDLTSVAMALLPQ